MRREAVMSYVEQEEMFAEVMQLAEQLGYRFKVKPRYVLECEGREVAFDHTMEAIYAYLKNAAQYDADRKRREALLAEAKELALK
jgi:hypothetical protein